MARKSRRRIWIRPRHRELWRGLRVKQAFLFGQRSQPKNRYARASSRTVRLRSAETAKLDNWGRRQTAMGSPTKAHMFVAASNRQRSRSAVRDNHQAARDARRVRPIVAPSVAKANFLALGAELEACTAAGCEWLHCSVQDGVFVPKVSFGTDRSICYQVRELIDPWRAPTHVIDVKLGCIDPENRVAEFAAAGADAISFHPEATKQPAAVAHRIRDAGVAPGIVLNPGTAVASVEPLLDMVDLAVVMLVSPGYGGPKYTEQAVEKVKALRALRPDLHISVDGGVNAKLAPSCRAGANVLVAGGAIFKADDKAGRRDC